MPMRRSRPMPVATSPILAFTFSHRFATSLIKAILVANNPLAAYLINSDDRRSVRRMRPRSTPRLRYNRISKLAARLLCAPMTTRSGRRKSSKARPARKNSGFEATSKSRSGRTLRISCSILSPVPTGTVDLITTRALGWRAGARSSIAR